MDSRSYEGQVMGSVHSRIREVGLTMEMLNDVRTVGRPMDHLAHPWKEFIDFKF